MSWVQHLALLFAALSLAPETSAQGVDEYQVKAAYLYNFAKFVEWPARPGGPNEPIRFCVLGQNPFGHALEKALSGKTIDEHPLVLAQIPDPKQAAACHVLFVSSSERKHLHAILSELGTQSILTVGESDDFLDAGGVVRFLLDSGRVRMEFNLDVASSAKLHISAKLLNLGTVVRKAER